MEENQLLIAVPTKDHPEHMRYFLSELLPSTKKHNVDICIYDSSSTETTKQIVDGWQARGYSNLFYKKLSGNMKFWEKLKYIFVQEKYEYLWLCGDGFVPCLEECIDSLEEEMGKGRDLIGFTTRSDAELYLEVTDPLDLMEKYWNESTCWAPWIVGVRFFTKKLWGGGYRRGYKNFAQVGAIFEELAKGEFDAVIIHSTFCKTNPFKRASTWIMDGKVFEVMEDYMDTVEKLPAVYGPVKWICAKPIFESYINTGILFLWRVDGNLTLPIVIKHRRLFQRYKRISFWKALVIAFCPKKAANLLCVMNGSKATMYK